MDNWQKHVFDRCSEFLGEDCDYSGTEKLTLNQREAYVVLKALEDQQKYLNPLLCNNGFLEYCKERDDGYTYA